ncbi:MAG: YveK family protein [Thomasclavelia sp.]|uniref:YveK family protein n=1 Tax=Thomasclavelia sp. TaxID=3025757 RepID=UPI0039A030A3
MDKTELNDEVQIDLSELFKLIKKHLKLIIIFMLVGIVIAGSYTTFMIEKKYSSQGTILLKAQVVDGTVDSTQLNSNNSMIANYIKLLQGNNIQDKIAKNLDISTGLVRGALQISNTEDTQIIEIGAVTNDPGLSKRIVDETISVFTETVKEMLDISNIIIVDNAEINTSPVSPSLKKNMLLGAVAGVIISLGYILLAYLLDSKIKNGETAEQVLDLPVLGAIPYFEDQ